MEKLINRRVNKGGNREESVALLAELLEAHEGDNLVFALVYNGFATEAAATKFVEAL